MFDFLKIKQTIASLAAELQKLRAEREQLMQKREDLEAAPACKLDLVELLDAWVDRRAEDFPRRLEVGLAFYRRHALLMLPSNPKAATHPARILTAALNPDGMATPETLENSLFFVLRDQIKAGLRQAIEQLDFTAAGPPRAERIETLKAIDARIDELDTAEQELISQAEQSGLRL